EQRSDGDAGRLLFGLGMARNLRAELKQSFRENESKPTQQNRFTVFSDRPSMYSGGHCSRSQTHFDNKLNARSILSQRELINKDYQPGYWLKLPGLLSLCSSFYLARFR